MEQKQQLPNATATLILGILSIVTCWLWGIIGLVLGIIALVISKKPMQMYKEEPDKYEGYGNLRAGRITSIIGLCLSAVYVIIVIVAIVTLGMAAFSLGSVFDMM